MHEVCLIVHDVRSCHNVGSLLRTAEGLGVYKVFLTGYTPYPETVKDARLPHLRAKISRQINKTALGAEETVDWEHREDALSLLAELKKQGWHIAALEQAAGSVGLPEHKPDAKTALVVGSEIGGLDKSVLETADVCLEIPMKGKKESFNVAVAAAIALYHLTQLSLRP